MSARSDVRGAASPDSDPGMAPWLRFSLCVLSAAGATAAIFFAVVDLGLPLSDEGHLWFGIDRVVAGDVPIRDFRSYDPGRYYWGAAWSSLLGEGIFGVRASSRVFQLVTLCLGLLALARLSAHPLLLAPGDDRRQDGHPCGASPEHHRSGGPDLRAAPG